MRLALTQEVDAVIAVAEPPSGPGEGEVDSIVGKIGLGAVSRQVVVVADVGSRIAEYIDGRNLRSFSSNGIKQEIEQEKEKKRARKKPLANRSHGQRFPTHTHEAAAILLGRRGYVGAHLCWLIYEPPLTGFEKGGSTLNKATEKRRWLWKWPDPPRPLGIKPRPDPWSPLLQDLLLGVLLDWWNILTFILMGYLTRYNL